MSVASPYLSVVATTRNDNHGGDLDRRTQIFIDALASQAAKHRLPVELLIVEWNPPADRPPLATAYRWPKENPWITVRIVTVPAELHRRYRFSDLMPLFQMIAKNTGVRRAAGRFVLATNVDVVLSEPLFAWIASGKARQGVLYRCDRVDVERNIPADAPLDEQLGYCERNVLRVWKRDATWLVPPGSRSKTLADATARAGEHSATAVRRFLVALMSAIPPVRFVLLEMRRARAVLKLYGYRPTLRDWLEQVMVPWRPLPPLHYNACGDFMLMDQDSWGRIRGSPELEMFPTHHDSLTMVTAFREGIQVEELPATCVHYHIEHAGGVTPEHSVELHRRINARGIPLLFHGHFVALATRLLKDRSFFLSPETWGLASDRLSETRVT